MIRKSHGDEVSIFVIKIFLRWSLIILATIISLDFALNKKGCDYFSQVFLKKCKCNEKKIIRHIRQIYDLESSSDDSDEPDENGFCIN